MSLGVITWRIQAGKIISTDISQVERNGQPVNSSFQNIKDIFTDLTVSVTDDYQVTAWIHIQDGKDFFQLRDIGQVNGQRLSNPFTYCQEKLFYGKDQAMKPILHISVWDFLDAGKYNVYFPRYSSVMDSSIWNYYLWIKDKSDDVKAHAAWIVSRIANNDKNGIYRLTIAKEYADLNARLVCESYIASESKGHGAHISPFLFHSEWEMEKKCELIIKELEQYRWRFLLIDDHAWRSMDKAIETDALNVQHNSKLDILSRTIEDMGLSVQVIIKSGDNIVRSDSEEHQVQIWGVDSIREAFSALQYINTEVDNNPQKYDIILLDYLLGKHSLEKKDDVFGNKEGYYLISDREYGYQFLKRIKESDSHPNISLGNQGIPCVDDGPVGQQFFMFISAFTTAVGERLRAESLHRSEKKWYIAEGACPTNTPSLFRYYLARVMEHRLKQTCIENLSYDSILNTLNLIFDSNSRSRYQRIKSVRENAYAMYKDVLGLHYDYFTLKIDENRSLLVNSFLCDKDHMDALLEHLLQFIHLIAFGTVRQWPEIWEEYKFVIRTMNIPPNNTKLSKEVQRVSRMIEKHIIDMKSE